jgi:hypothetical protein
MMFMLVLLVLLVLMGLTMWLLLLLVLLLLLALGSTVEAPLLPLLGVNTRCCSRADRPGQKKDFLS